MSGIHAVRNAIRNDALLERRALRQVEQPVLVDGGALGVAAAVGADEADHAAPVGGLARDLAARHERERRRLRVPPLADEDVGVVDAGGADVDDDLAVARLGLGHVAQLESALLVEDDRRHVDSSAPR